MLLANSEQVPRDGMLKPGQDGRRQEAETLMQSSVRWNLSRSRVGRGMLIDPGSKQQTGHRERLYLGRASTDNWPPEGLSIGVISIWDPTVLCEPKEGTVRPASSLDCIRLHPVCRSLPFLYSSLLNTGVRLAFQLWPPLLLPSIPVFLFFTFPFQSAQTFPGLYAFCVSASGDPDGCRLSECMHLLLSSFYFYQNWLVSPASPSFAHISPLPFPPLATQYSSLVLLCFPPATFHSS